jgi:hypothetical protein
MPKYKCLKFEAINLESNLIIPKTFLINNTIPLLSIRNLENRNLSYTKRFFRTGSLISSHIIPKYSDTNLADLNKNIFLYDIIENFLKSMKLKTDSTKIKTLLDCDKFYLEKERLSFRRKLSKVSGIYM